MLRDFEQRRTQRVGALLEKQKLREEVEKQVKLEEKKKADKQLIDRLEEEEMKKKQRAQTLKKWLKEKDAQKKERDSFHSKAMTALLDKQTRQAEKTQATEQQRLVERAKRLKIIERKKFELEERVRECSQGQRMRSGKDKYITTHHHHHHHMHYHHGVPQNEEDQEGQDFENYQIALPQPSLSIEDQMKRCEMESEQRVAHSELMGPPLANTAQSFASPNGGDGDVTQPPAQLQMARTHPMDDFVRSNATVATIQRCATVAGGLPRISQRVPKYHQTLQRAMGTYADSGRPFI